MKKIAVAAALFAVLFGCKEDPDFPNVPQIETVSFQIIDGEAYWKFSFKDGDGNLGSSLETDTNFFQSIVNLSKDTTIAFVGERIPAIEIVGGSKGIEGEITKSTNLAQLQLIGTGGYTKQDTVYFTTYIVDNAGNRSNLIRTPAFKENPIIIFSNE